MVIDRVRSSVRVRAGFTLTELMIAVAILIVIVAATGKIFSTASKVTAVGQASADVLQTASAIERQIRQDVARLSDEGFIALRSVRVPNNVNQVTQGPQAPLLNPALPETATVRADQLVFFITGVQGTQQFIGSAEDAFTDVRNQQATAARIYYGHGIQLGELAEPGTDPVGFNSGQLLAPWSWNDPAAGPDLDMQTFAASPAPAPPINGTQPEARQWNLARQQLLLADDGASEFFFRSNQLNSTDSIWLGNSLLGSSGRVDVAATQMNDIRRIVTDFGANDWFQQRAEMLAAVYYPRAERISPSMFREDQMLTSSTLAPGCSSFIVEWTYADGTGDAFQPDGTLIPGMQCSTQVEQPWFGLPDAERAVYLAGDGGDVIADWDWGNVDAGTIDPDNIESTNTLAGNIEVYEAAFGFNRSQPLNDADPPVPDSDLGYTPWPTALRITMTLHDPKITLEKGRVFQFVVPLPRR